MQITHRSIIGSLVNGTASKFRCERFRSASRQNYYFSMLWVMAASGCAPPAEYWGQAPKPASAVENDESTHTDIGTVFPNSSTWVSWNISNTTSDTWHLTRVDVGCGCVRPEISQRVLEPGQTAEVRAVFNAGSSVADANQALTLVFGEWSKQLTFSAQIRNPINVRESPAGAQFTSHDGSFTETFTIEGFGVESLDTLSAVTKDEWVECHLGTSLVDDTQMPSRALTISGLVSTLEAGRVYSSVRLSVGDAVTEFPISVDIQPPARIIPTFAIVDSKKKKHSRHRIVPAKHILLQPSDVALKFDSAAIDVDAELTAQQIVESIHFARQELVSGRFRYTTKKWEVHEGENILGLGRDFILDKWNANVGFDFAAGKSVMDYNYEVSSGANVGHRFISADIDGSYWFYDGSRTPGSMHIMVKDRLQAQKTSTGIHPTLFLSPLDPRAVGVTTISDLVKSNDLDRSIEMMELTPTQHRAVTPLHIQASGDADDSESVVLVQYYQNGLLRRTFTIDVEQGFVARRTTLDFGKYDAETGEFESKRPRFSSISTWTLRNDVWIPHGIAETHHLVEEVEGSTEASSSVNPEDSPSSYVTRTLRAESSFEWSSVNEAIDSGEFDYRNFGLPAHSVIVDRRGPESKIIDRIGTQSRSQVASGGWRVQVGIAFAFVAIVVAGFLYWRR